MQRFVLLCLAATAFAAVQNVTFEPKRAVPDEAKTVLGSMHKKFQHRSDIADLINGLTTQMTLQHAEMLSGEARDSSLFTRTSASINSSQGIMIAIAYVEAKMVSYGFETERHWFREDWGPNLIAWKRGTLSPDQLVVMGTHLDDVPAQGRAPGANDDGSGSAALLATGQAISEADATFGRTLVLEFYSGEEQGLVGSRALAKRRADEGDNVIAQLQQDMTAVQLFDDPVGVAFVRDTRATDPTLTKYAMDVAKEYRPAGLTLFDRVISGSECCSDHQAYAENGFPAVGYIEPRGYTGDPQYHRAGDLVRRTEYNAEQIALAARVALAAAADLAGLN